MKLSYRLQLSTDFISILSITGSTLSLSIFIIFICSFTTQAQSGKNLQRGNNKSGSVFIKLPLQKSLTKEPKKLLEESLRLSKHDTFSEIEKKKDSNGFSHWVYQQYHKGVKVEYGVFKVHAKNTQVQAISGEQYEIPAIKTTPTISEKVALAKALDYVGAKVYKWQLESDLKPGKRETSYPSGELVICKVFINASAENEVALAYKFDIYAHEPLSRAYIYVDAHTGRIIHTDAIIKHASATAATRYSGTKAIETEQKESLYRLRDFTRGSGIETYNMKNSTSYTTAVDFTDNDNNWTTTEHANAKKDNAALDAHWGATMIYDYFKNVHGRNSFDGKGATIKNYVHYGVNYINAFWDGKAITYGDGGLIGSNTVEPLTSLDVVAHEIGHGICQHTAKLVYSYESGALNEGFSDIWAATIEYHVDPAKSMWSIGEDINFTIRSMSNPKEFGQPDTYLGTYWYNGTANNGGVHTNSGVLNYWYYLLVEGKAGVNDNGDAYNITGISMSKAAKIAYRTESVYLTPNAKYIDARNFSIQAAIDLYGAGSQEAIQTAKAWDAVGVYEAPVAPENLTATALSTTKISLSWIDQSANETGFQIERSVRPGGDFVKIATVAAGTTTYIDANMPSNFTYYYRVQAKNRTSGSNYSNEASATVGNAPITMSNTTITTCDASFLDPGGVGNYFENQSYITTFLPTSAGRKISVSFISFNTEEGFDYLTIYNGNSTDAPVIGRYTGRKLPPAITATNSAGALTFKFYSDGNVVYSGWQASITCTGSPASKLTPVITLADLNQTYDGNAKVVSATTVPAGLPVTILYNGSATAPINAGTYNVAATVKTADYEGSVNGTLIIDKAIATVLLSNLTQVYDGEVKQATATTIPDGKKVNIIYNGSETVPVNTGTYEVEAFVEDANYTGSATEQLVIKKGGATIIFSSLIQVYDGVAKTVTASTEPSGLPVALTYNGEASAPVNAGTYTVTGTVNTDNYQISVEEKLVIMKADQTVNFQALPDTVTVDALVELQAEASSNLPVVFTIMAGTASIKDNSVTFTAPGSVTIQAAQNGNDNYTPASPAVQTIFVKKQIIHKVEQTITFDPIVSQELNAAPFKLIAASSSQLPVSFQVVSGPAIIAEDIITFTGAGLVVISAIQSGNEQYSAAASVERSFCVMPPKPEITSSGNSLTPSAIVLLTSSSDSGNQWLLNGAIIEGATNNTYAVTQSGNYSVKVTAGQCETISDPVVLTGVDSKKLALSIHVYPNPAVEQFIVEYAAEKTSREVKVTLYTNMGVKIEERSLSLVSGIWQETFYVKHLASGSYLLFIQDGNHRYSRVVVKN